MSLPHPASTGLPGLDKIIHNLRFGDNVVWQVDGIESYRNFVSPFVENAGREGRKLIYVRFAKHPPLLVAGPGIKIYPIDADAGFESFSKRIHDMITLEGEGAYYVFDCLSDLLSSWATDLMIGNFFVVTCPYLFRLDTVAYFAIFRGNHSFKTIARIRETTQLLLDVYDFEGSYYVHPLKVWERHSPTMFLPHRQIGGEFLPLLSSADASRLFAYLSLEGDRNAERNLDYWDRLFWEARQLADDGTAAGPVSDMLEHLSRILLSREERMLKLIKNNFSLEDLLAIKDRMVGTGFIGGKALGMLLARKILLKDKDKNWSTILEPHDSFFIGADVFYTYMVENGWWEEWLEQKTDAGYFTKAAELQDKLLSGKFPHEIREQFRQLIEYFGQSPIIVRSSSLLEDAFGNAFAGKYESIFDVNQGSPEERYQQFEGLVRQVFASTMNEDALCYRLQRGLSNSDEQMALLVQRVSGGQHGQYFFPLMGGVGVSYNTFVWHKEMDPKAGMLRVVLGLGTRAVNRVEGDYPRIVALDNPTLRPYAGMEKVKKFSQHEVDVLNTGSNELQTVPLTEVLNDDLGINLEWLATRDLEAEEKLRQIGRSGPAWILTLDKILGQGNLVDTLQRMLKFVEDQYQYPVDIEFTVNLAADLLPHINLVQCRPLQTRGVGGQVKIPSNIVKSKKVFAANANFMGGNVDLRLCGIIFVDPKKYGDLLMSEKFTLARLIGRLNKEIIGPQKLRTILIGPGRWGTRDPSLGVPVSFAEINNMAALVEVDDPSGGFMPELSFGSHFFLDLVETNIFYAALFMGSTDVFFDEAWLKQLPNHLLKFLPEAAPSTEALKLHIFNAGGLRLLSDITAQKVVCLKPDLQK
ncbi:MAG: PEP/pyruvate-binding domain-containing protein [Candidatus Margulisiibacteriota bacterium]